MSRELLLIKLSSLGDVIHGFAMLGDLAKAMPDVKVSWVVEEAFADLVSAHPLVKNVIVVPLRRLRKEKRWWWSKQWREMRKQLRTQRYFKVVDAQGLLKSALLMRMIRTDERIGYDNVSAREPLAALAYHQCIRVEKGLHAVERMRLLMGGAFDYQPEGQADYGLPLWQPSDTKQLLFFHGTTWRSKQLPEKTWHELIKLANHAGFNVVLPWGNVEERERAERLARSGAKVLPKLSLVELQQEIYRSAGVISVDTGLGHLAAACGAPVLGIFGPTDATLTGMMGIHAKNLSHANPCMKKDCHVHGGTEENSCMHIWQAGEIWETFLTLQE
ncbi:lipopolysaccharide heptosyltransferase I [Suttonella ornithocola]|uniref:Lipopolysaccharide heptosyltransferase 1 n=1 Tax=Suttonella ornithocola TaxID=279832 RepID=A0A380MWM6_9GAMM|nr:lipopolysaccharide heptosyltransferase I [Suttonella ornithocola]SUO97010.1 Lipopolysaccharide heptosyltransferase 1 [Suttonella ornithocola]